MNSKVAASIESAKKAGFKVEPTTLPGGESGFQLKNAEGTVIHRDRSEESLWSHAFNRGRLPKPSTDAK